MSACGTWDYRGRALHGCLFKGSQPVFTQVSEKTTENSERLGRQARPRNEPGTSRLPVFERSHWWGQRTDSSTPMPYPGYEPGTFGSAAGFPNCFAVSRQAELKMERCGGKYWHLVCCVPVFAYLFGGGG